MPHFNKYHARREREIAQAAAAAKRGGEGKGAGTRKCPNCHQDISSLNGRQKSQHIKRCVEDA